MGDFLITRKLSINKSKLEDTDKLESQVIKVSEKLCKGWDNINVSLMPDIVRDKVFLILTNYQ